METRPIFYLKDYQPTPYEIKKIDLKFFLDPQTTRVVATSQIQPRRGIKKSALILDGEELRLISIKINDELFDCYEEKGNKLHLTNLPSGEFKLEIITEIKPSENKQLMGLYISNNIFCTQCEAEGFRRITYFYDRPDILAVYNVYIEAQKHQYPVLLANGNLIEQGDLENGRHFAIWHDPFPKPCYLFALVGGDLDKTSEKITTAGKRSVELNIYTEKSKTERAIYALDSLKRSMVWDEKRFGREYDLDIFNIVAVSDFNMGAMENKGLNIFNDKFVLCDQNTATDGDFAGVERVIAHEYFHNWTGNRITCRDWFQLCLKEGLTVFRDQEFTADERSAALQRISAVRTLITAQFSVDKSPLSHPVRPDEYREINNFYTTTIYEKGAELIRMLQTMFGKQLFRKSMDLYFERHDGQACIMEDYIKCFEDVTGYDLSQFMLWYSQSGTPHVEYSVKQSESELEIKLKQSLKKGQNKTEPKAMLMPISYALFDEQGNEFHRDILMLSQEEQSFKIAIDGKVQAVSMLRGLSSPVTITKIGAPIEEIEQEEIFLARYETDPTNRWMIIQKMLFKELDNIISGRENCEQNFAKSKILPILCEIAKDEKLDPELRAFYLSMPSEREIAQNYEQNIDPIIINKARKSLISSLAAAGKDVFAYLLEKYEIKDPYSPDSKQTSHRALYNTALLYHSLAEKDYSKVLEQYMKADNLTNRVAALAILVNYFHDSSERRQAMEDFYKRYQDTPLVLDKWFALQATYAKPEALDRVKELISHEKFDLYNPNRTYALLGSFAYGNQLAFNREDGLGYQFIIDIILKLDSKNPHLSSRLLNAFGDWKKYKPQLQAEAQKSLEKIKLAENISNDLSDIITRIIS